MLKNEAHINLQDMFVNLDSMMYEHEDKNGISEYDMTVENKSKIYALDGLKLPDSIK